MDDDYRAFADAIAADIAAGSLRPGDRLPTQRRFARDRGIAVSTASRVYGELVRRGLVVGEVGRGTFVRAAPPMEPWLAEPSGTPVDLQLNFSVLPGQPARQAASMERLLRPDVLGTSLETVGVAGTSAMRELTAGFLARAGWTPSPAQVLFSGNGRQVLAGAISALVPTGERLGVEALTYPLVKAIAGRLGVQLVPLEMDEHGVRPEALAAASVRAVYLQPTLHNPLGITMPDERRAEIASTVRALDLPVIEDAVYAYLAEDVAPLAHWIPERTIVVDSMSKRLAPGLTLGFAVVAEDYVERVTSALRSGGWTAPHFAMTAAAAWMSDGTAASLAADKRRDALSRQALMRSRLAGFRVTSDPRCFHCWWELPEPWRAETFLAAAARQGIAVSPAASFTTGAGHAPNAIRLALSVPPEETLTWALDVLAALARSTPEAAGID
ncbi:DNA-binding transcriptional regulator, MocR family, contains an aminotransferase domain [Amycolatopsis xylanica]|uniref:DNA-binding transcriptional regulator, MocR family, contains an aminotransferase domain n=1 Tax=Amycolatopsis xylanica TaxID=589385 RepID=A0A1H3TCC8_9PSEU|nr:PLP-dependent aminotransferase family protein [Amycolatopsis xylanica]SDZ47607.1 DNA-binding transcriptional regulator, MocR family, contains an aminotransferase domain [Amycolatopsis xylanica]